MNRRANGTGGKPWWNATRKRFEIKVSLADGGRRTVRGKTEREVERKREVLLTAVETGRPTPTQVLSTAAYLRDDWLESVLATTMSSTRGTRGQRKRGTYRDYESLTRIHIIPTLGKYPLAKLSTAIIQRDLIDKKIRQGSSIRRVQMMATVLHIALKRAVRFGLVTHNAADGLDIRVPDNSRVDRALTPDQTLALLEAMRPYRYGTLVTFLVCTGLRLGEALALRWSEVDLQRRELLVERTLDWLPLGEWDRIDTKTHRRRRVPLLAPAIQALLAEQDRQAFARRRVGPELWQDNNLVFSNDFGDPIREESARDGFKRGIEMAGLNPSEHRVHDLRHTTGAYLHMLGVPLPTIMRIMGHSTVVMSQRYSAVFDSMLDEARETLDNFFTGLGVK